MKDFVGCAVCCAGLCSYKREVTFGLDEEFLSVSLELAGPTTVPYHTVLSAHPQHLQCLLGSCEKTRQLGGFFRARRLKCLSESETRYSLQLRLRRPAPSQKHGCLPACGPRPRKAARRPHREQRLTLGSWPAPPGSRK